MKRRYYSHKKRECSVCGLLCTPESFKYHNSLECYAMEQQNKELEKEIKGGGNRGLSIMRNGNEVDIGWGI